MSEVQNTQVVKDAYAAFMRGDIDAILASLDDEVEWEAVKGSEGVVPTAGMRRGRRGVAEFFSQVGANFVFNVFEPREFVAEGEAVVAIGYYEATVKETGRSIASDWVMIFSFRNGKIVRFRELTDSAALVRAFTVAAPV